MKKYYWIFSFFFLVGCDKNIELTEVEDKEIDLPQKPSPPIISVDTSLVIIKDTMQISF